ncbi:MAG: amino acid racemase [Polyangiaceae bacterium]|jgi:aspartate racemase|nr:amino acid racemase [Polyangiaceae bacterium]
MPRITPAAGEQYWPESEGALGVVGVAPWATLAFCQVLYRLVRASKDWHYPRVLLDINTKIPSRGRHLQLGEADPSPAIAETIAELAAQGATVAVVPCNTAHILYERWSRGAPIPVLHIIEETVRLALARGAVHVVPLVSHCLAQSRIYEQQAVMRGLRCATLAAEDQRTIGEIIEVVKNTASINDSGEHAMRALLERMRARGVDTVIAGCTELSGLQPVCDRVGLRLVDSNVALSHAALARLRLPDTRFPSFQVPGA